MPHDYEKGLPNQEKRSPDEHRRLSTLGDAIAILNYLIPKEDRANRGTKIYSTMPTAQKAPEQPFADQGFQSRNVPSSEVNDPIARARLAVEVARGDNVTVPKPVSTVFPEQGLLDGQIAIDDLTGTLRTDYLEGK